VRYLAVAFIAAVAVVAGCADEKGGRLDQAMPTQGDAPSAASEAKGGDGAESGSLESSDPDAPCAVSFTKDVMPKLSTTCGTSACHQEAIAPSIETETPQITFESLRDFGFDDPEWVDPHPNDSHLAEPEMKTAIDGWRACGAPFE
jgi:hypothetical protein